MSELEFTGKVAIVTGSSSGIGEAIAVQLASRGAKVTLCGRDPERLRAALDNAVAASGGLSNKFLAVLGDLNDQKIQEEVVSKTVITFGRLDILVANAGLTGAHQTLSSADEETYDKIMNTNLKSVFFLIQKAIPYLAETKGNIVNISSIASTMVIPAILIYSLSKVALDHLTRCLAVDLGPKGIRVNSVQPGYISTNIIRVWGQKFMEEKGKEIEQKEQNWQILKQRGLASDDVVEAVLYLASNKTAAMTTGVTIQVDGGSRFRS